MASSLFWTDGTAAEAIAVVTRALDAAIERREPYLLEGAFEYLVKYHERRALEGGGDDDAHRRFLQRVSESLITLRREIISFVFETSTEADTAREPEQIAVSWRRSAIQFLLDEHPAVLEALGPEWRFQLDDMVDSIDHELRRMGTDYGRLPDEDLPRGLPKSHWWWWPEPKPGYERWPGYDEPP